MSSTMPSIERLKTIWRFPLLHRLPDLGLGVVQRIKDRLGIGRSKHYLWEDVPIYDVSRYKEASNSITETFIDDRTGKDVTDEWSPEISNVVFAWWLPGESVGSSIPIAIVNQVGYEWFLEDFQIPTDVEKPLLSYTLNFSGTWMGQPATGSAGRTIFL